MKVAIVGTEPMSQGFAPWDDPSWEIWTMGLRMIRAPRIDRHFELHSLDRLAKTDQGVVEYIAWLRANASKVVLAKGDPRVPGASELDRESLEKEFGPYFWTSSVAWMAGLAIFAGATHLGFWGIDMIAADEYASQRPGCHFFIYEAQKRGIEVVVPPESCLAQPPAPYGFREFLPFYRKNLAARAFYEGRLKEALKKQDACTDEVQSLRGMLQQIEINSLVWGGLK